MSILKKRSSTKFIRNKKGRVVKTIRTGSQTFKDYDLKLKVKKFEAKQKIARKSKRKKKTTKPLKSVDKWISRNIASEAEMLKRLKKL